MSDDPLIGQLVDGQFLVELLLGEGGMGRVYRARQVELDRPVALKILPQGSVGFEERKIRFHREARAASRINHPGSVVIHSFGEWQGQLYIAMELLSGVSLGDVLETAHVLPGERAARVLIQVCDVLRAAHAAGVLHRDLKPDNIMLVKGPHGEEQVKVVDFGLAILKSGTDKRVTKDGMVAGTPHYMSPEQCRGGALDERSDLYALGVVLYQMLCGKVPFIGETATDIIVQHMYHDPDPPSDLNRQVAIHPSLESLALWALSKAPEARPQSAEELGEELRAALLLIEHQQLPPDLQRKDPLLAGGRMARAVAVGLPLPGELTTKEDLPSKAAGVSVLVVESPEVRFSESLTAYLREHKFTVTPTPATRDLLRLAREAGAALVCIDLGGDPEGALGEIARLAAEGLSAWPLVVVGPASPVRIMSRALELGLDAYVPRQSVGNTLARTIKKVLRRRSRGLATPR